MLVRVDAQLPLVVTHDQLDKFKPNLGRRELVPQSIMLLEECLAQSGLNRL